MKTLKRFATRVIARLRKVFEPDFTASQYPVHSTASMHVRHPDSYNDTITNQSRGGHQDDFLAGPPRRQNPNATCVGFPRRAGIVASHGWRIPTPPRLPVND
jgi:hypothetical protein